MNQPGDEARRNELLRFFDRQGNPITLDEWGAKFEDMQYRTVGRDTVPLPGGANVEVCTAWHGHDDEFMDEHIFSTGYRVDEGKWVTVEYYDTEDTATAGHKAVVERIRVDLRP